MNRLDLRALGWVVTRDVCSEIARVALGGRRRIPLAALRELGVRWRAIHASPTANQATELHALLVGNFATSLSKQHEKAVGEFVDSLQACCPELYSEQALRHRFLNLCGQAVASCALGAILACWTSADIPIIGDSALVLFAMGCWSLVTAVQLWRTRHLVKRIGQFKSLRGLSAADDRLGVGTDRDWRPPTDGEHRESSKS